MNIRVKVTAKDIKCGEKEMPDSCPIALAVGRATKSAYVCVDCEGIEWGNGKEVHGVCHLKKTRKFMDDFDDSRPVKPFEFTLRVRK